VQDGDSAMLSKQQSSGAPMPGTPSSGRISALRAADLPLLERRVRFGAVQQCALPPDAAQAAAPCQQQAGDASSHPASPNDSSTAPTGSCDEADQAPIAALPPAHAAGVLDCQTLAHDQVQQLSALRVQRQAAREVVNSELDSPRGLRSIMPPCSPGAVADAVRLAEQRRLAVGASPARPRTIARRCAAPPAVLACGRHDAAGSTSLDDMHHRPAQPSTVAAQASREPCSTMQREPATTSAAQRTPCTQQHNAAAMPPMPQSPASSCIDWAGEDGRDSRGRCVDRHAYKGCYGIWPAHEALITFAALHQEVASDTAPPSKKARRQRPPSQHVCLESARADLLGLAQRPAACPWTQSQQRSSSNTQHGTPLDASNTVCGAMDQSQLCFKSQGLDSSCRIGSGQLSHDKPVGHACAHERVPSNSSCAATTTMSMLCDQDL
jgi:hypothetical protein